MNQLHKALIQMINVAYTLMEQTEGLKKMQIQTEHTEVTWSILDGKLYSMMRGLKDLLEKENPENIYKCKEFIRQWEALKSIAHLYQPALLHCDCEVHKEKK